MELWRAQAGCGKTEAVVSLIAETVRQQPFARIWAVLPNSRQRAQFRARVQAKLSAEGLPALNVELFNFYSLNRRLLGLLRVPVKSVRDGARFALLRSLAARESLATFGPVADKAGFARAVGDLISELKQARVEPAEFVQSVRRPQDEDLARIYDTYQVLLREHDMVDTEGEAWLALESLNADIEWDPEIALLAFDGFDQFTEVQAQLIRALTRRAERTVVTLTTVEGREDGVGRRFASAQILLGARTVLDIEHDAHTQPAVRHILEHGFRYGAAPTRMPAGAAQTLSFIEAHSPSAEAAEVMRQIKRRLVYDACQPDDILIVLRDWARYQPALVGAAVQYGVPLSLQSGSSLDRHPLASAINAILALPEAGFAFGAVIDALRSPFVALEGMTPELIAKVELAARNFRLRGGREAWDVALEAGARPSHDYLDREIPPILSRNELLAASDALNLLFDTLPHPDEMGTVWSFVERLEELIGADPDHETDADAKLGFTLDIARQIRLTDVSGDDLAALRAVKGALYEMLLTEDLHAALSGGDRMLRWRDFLVDFNAALQSADVGSAPDRSGRVLVTTANDARGSSHKHVYILGLSEGIFPAPLPDDPLFLDTERADLRYNGQAFLRSAADRADDDSIFFQLVALASETLTLSRPSLNNGQVWPASSLWNSIVSLLDGADFEARRIRIAPGRPPSADSAASLPELAAAIGTRTATAAGYLERLDPMLAAHIAHAQRVERARYDFAQTRACEIHAEHIGDLSRSPNRSLAEKLSRATYPWSASTINALGTCAYRVFADKLLGLDELEDPSEGADAALEGSLMHRILEATYAGFRTRGRTISPENLNDALAALEKSAAEVFENAMERRELIPSPIWPHQQRVILRYLEDLVRRDFSDSSPVAAFGSGSRWTLVTEKKFGDDRPITISVETQEGTVAFCLTGSIDRVDCIDTGSAYRLVVIDYKRGGGAISSGDVAEGRSTQVVLYAAVLQTLIDDPRQTDRSVWFRDLPPKPVEIAGGMFWSIRAGTPQHILAPDVDYSVDKRKLTADELRAQCLDAIATRIARVRAGDFRPVPDQPSNGKCAHFCTFSDLCRVCELL